ncbi:N2227-like protein-domain-containing protein [Scenedesmus sp. NREL 46B-D3]|nr:N2227-like protein-domain-containing protein [Scenedesmus sp. NREL 46B-D3]
MNAAGFSRAACLPTATATATVAMDCISSINSVRTSTNAAESRMKRFWSSRHWAEREIQRWEHNYRALSARHRALLAHLPAKAAAARRAVQQNQMFIKALLMDFAGEGQEDEQQQGVTEAAGSTAAAAAGNSSSIAEGGNDRAASMPGDLAAGALSFANGMAAQQQQCGPADAEKVRYVLKNLVRDWSAEGALERQQCYARLVAQLKLCFEGWPGPQPPRVLLPGAGLGRLCAEVAAAGFEAQGNEFSYFMLLTAAFLLNSTNCQQQWTVHPWVHVTCNNVTNEDQLRAVGVPDVVPSSLVPPGMLSMCAGDFVEVYSQPDMAGSFDAVVTCFFIDTAHNILEYLEVIHRVLKRGGYWIHMGPLLWHWADGSWDELSLELSLADVQQAALLMGFSLTSQEFVDAAYIANTRSMYKTVYQAAFWTMQKTEQQLPQDLNQLVQMLALQRQQQQQQRQQQPPSMTDPSQGPRCQGDQQQPGQQGQQQDDLQQQLRSRAQGVQE